MPTPLSAGQLVDGASTIERSTLLPIQESSARRAVSASVVATLTLGLKIGGNFIIIPLALKYLGREQYGMWIILQSIATYLTMSEIGIGQTLMNYQNVAFAKGDHTTVNRLLATGVGVCTLIVIPLWLAFTLLLVFFPVSHWLLKDVSGPAAVIFSAYLFLSGTLTLARVPLYAFPATLLGLREVYLRNGLEFVTALFVLGGTILTLVLHGKLLALILVLNVGSMALLISSYPLARSRHGALCFGKGFLTTSLMWPLFANSVFFFLYNLGLLFQRVAGNLLAGKLGSLREVPEVFVLITLFRVVGWGMADIGSQTLLPYMIIFPVHGRWDRVVFFSKLCTKLSFALALFYTALVWIYADMGIRLWLGPGMFLGYGPLACLGGAFLIDVLFLSTNNFMRGHNCHRRLAVAMATYALLSFVLGVVGAKWWMPAQPLLGLCAGLLLASIVAQGLPLPWLTYKWLGIGGRQFVDHFLLRPLLLVSSAVAVILLFKAGAGSGLSLRLLATLALTMLLPLVTWFAVLGKDERHWIGAQMHNFKRAGIAYLAA
jgi:O-antigen/teichoic acid export membrane protein